MIALWAALVLLAGGEDAPTSSSGDGEVVPFASPVLVPVFAPEPTPQPSADAASSAADPTSGEAAAARRSRNPRWGAELGIQARMLQRDLAYRDDVFDSLSDYALDAAPALALRLRVFPGAWLMPEEGAFFGHIGVEARYARAFDLDSELEVSGETRQFETENERWYAGLAGRVPIGDTAHQVDVGLGYGEERFEVKPLRQRRPTRVIEPGVPRVHYRFIRVALGGRAQLPWGFSLRASFAGLQVQTSGEIEDADWFPRSWVGGLDAELGLGYALPAGLELGLSWDYRRFFFDLRPEPGDSRVAGGVADSYTAFNFGVWYRL